MNTAGTLAVVSDEPHDEDGPPIAWLRGLAASIPIGVLSGIALDNWILGFTFAVALGPAFGIAFTGSTDE